MRQDLIVASRRPTQLSSLRTATLPNLLLLLASTAIATPLLNPYGTVNSATGVLICDSPNLTGKCTFEHNTDKASRMNKCLSIASSDGKMYSWSMQLFAGTICTFSDDASCPCNPVDGKGKGCGPTAVMQWIALTKRTPTRILGDISTEPELKGMRSVWCFMGDKSPWEM
jgi:hypothetical protein